MKNSSVRSSNGLWINSSLFREAASTFEKNSYYTAEPWGSPAWFDFWQEERRRCLQGYEVGGARITGDHYFYLNYSPIRKSEKSESKIGAKITGFPDFWDGDYNYFWLREIARNGVLPLLTSKERDKFKTSSQEDKDKILQKAYDSLGLFFRVVPNLTNKSLRIDNLLGGKDLIVLKSRRKGFSYKNASIPVNNYFHRPGTYSLFMAYDKKYLFPKGIFTMSMNYINFVNENTAWVAPSDYIRRQDHIRNSYKMYRDGVEIEKGYMSEIQAISFKDNPQAGVGKDAYDIFGEEVGTWGVPGGLKDTVHSMLPSIQDGDIKTGMMTLFGTANDAERGTVDFADLFTNIESGEFLPFYDIWGEDDKKKEGFFFPAQLNLVGHYDINGNSDLKSATESELLSREKLKLGGANSDAINKRKREFPLHSGEALTLGGHSVFPVDALKTQLEKVKSKNLQSKKGTPVILTYEGSKVVAKPDLKREYEPITSYRTLPQNLKGCVIVYEYPVEDAPKGLYKIGYDPIHQDSGTSLAAIVVYKSSHRTTTTKNNIVAEYIGRYDDPDDIDRIAEKLADFYNTVIMYENMVTGTKNYFRKIKRLNLLAAQPDKVISKNIINSKVSRVYGCHMNTQLIYAGERYVNTWLNEIVDYDENDEPIRTIDNIYSIRILEELIYYNRKGNFDMVSALFMCIFQVQEEELGTVHESHKKNNKIEQLLESVNKRFPKNR